MNEQQMIRNISIASIGGNTLLTLFKLVAGILGHSGAMISDAVHSMSDVFTTIVAVIGVRISMKKADRNHPYGHERLECVASIILGSILLLTGAGIGYAGLLKVLHGNYSSLTVPTVIALIAAIVSILAKELMYQYTMHYAKILESNAFMADAWHHRSDALSSIGSLIGIGGAMLGFPVLDPLASIVICFFIWKVSFEILYDAFKKMLDTSCSEEFEAELSNFIKKQPGVMHLDVLHTRMFGNKIYIDAEIGVDKNRTLIDAHNISEQVHARVEKKYPNIKHIMIHVNPM